MVVVTIFFNKSRNSATTAQQKKFSLLIMESTTWRLAKLQEHYDNAP
jgi:hypothetical protein